MILHVDMHSENPIYLQLRQQIILGIASGQLERGEAMPSVRRLAADLGINLHTVNKVYAILRDEGYLIMDRRRGAVVSHDVPDDAFFAARLTQNLTLLAAEARCHGIDDNAFLSLCADAYRHAGQPEQEER